jgi:hypothetical protein
MRSDKVDDAALEPQTEAGVVYRLLDPVFGFGVWAAHLLMVYVSTAVMCQLGLGSREASVHSSVLISLSVVTFVAAALVLWHAVKRYRQRQEMRDHGFLVRIAIGHDAVAALAIVSQLMPLWMVPLCR